MHVVIHQIYSQHDIAEILLKLC